MDEVIAKIEALVKKYPEHIKKYPPVKLDVVPATEKMLHFPIGPSLLEIYKYSDGLGFLDYALLSINNKNMEKLATSNDTGTIKERGGIEFMGTSGDERFILDTDGKTVRYITEEFDDVGVVVATSVEGFFREFVAKIEVLMTHVGPDDVVRYFTDEDIQSEFSDWHVN
ncbi:MAG TPA: hypothetical protein VK508_17935 [Cyclobacteriaceae bacterium]|nr:hypothetical protein [Cyclobacteriaceae bacterium]